MTVLIFIIIIVIVVLVIGQHDTPTMPVTGGAAGAGAGASGNAGAGASGNAGVLYIEEPWFSWMHAGEKTIDLRPAGSLGKIKAGDVLTYYNDDAKFDVKVSKTHEYSSVRECLEAEPDAFPIPHGIEFYVKYMKYIIPKGSAVTCIHFTIKPAHVKPLFMCAGETAFLKLKRGKKMFYEIEHPEISDTTLLMVNPLRPHFVFHPVMSKIRGARVIYVDPIGFGKSDWGDDKQSNDQTIEDYEELRVHLGIQKWHVLGWSAGGIVIGRYAMLYPQHVAGLIYVAGLLGMIDVSTDVNPYTDADTKILDSLPKDVSHEQMAYSKLTSVGWKRQYFVKPSKDHARRAAVLPAMMEKSRFSHPGWGEYDIQLPKDIPIVSIDGRHDPGIDINKKKEYLEKTVTNVRSVIIERASHSVFNDSPGPAIDAINDALGSM